jgi:hypothetical protein
MVAFFERFKLYDQFGGFLPKSKELCVLELHWNLQQGLWVIPSCKLGLQQLTIISSLNSANFTTYACRVAVALDQLTTTTTVAPRPCDILCSWQHLGYAYDLPVSCDWISRKDWESLFGLLTQPNEEDGESIMVVGLLPF